MDRIGSSGIGRAASQAYSREGARVAVVDIYVEGGGEDTFLHADVSSIADTQVGITNSPTTCRRISNCPVRVKMMIGPVSATIMPGRFH